jgi:serine/threonine protein kinase
LIQDVWSFGVILYQLLKWNPEISSYIINSTDKIEESLKGEDKILSEIVCSCLTKQYKQRPSLEEIIELLKKV